MQEPHISEIFSCLEGVFEPVLRLNDPVQIFAVALRSELMRKSYGDYLFLSEWGNPRRLNSSEAVIEVLKQADSSGLKATEIVNLASILLGRPVRRDSIHSSLYDAGAKFNVMTKRWTLPDANEVEEAIQFNAE